MIGHEQLSGDMKMSEPVNNGESGYAVQYRLDTERQNFITF